MEEEGILEWCYFKWVAPTPEFSSIHRQVESDKVRLAASSCHQTFNQLSDWSSLAEYKAIMTLS